ncbi:MAG: LEA type 2 family protein [Phycisphaerales bacterium]
MMQNRAATSVVARVLACVVAAGCAIGLGGCAGGPAPTVSVEDAVVTERTEQGVVALFTIAIENPTAEPLPMRSVDYSLALGGREVFRGVRAPTVTLPASGTQRFKIPAAIRAADLPQGTSAGLFQFTLRGRLVYSEPGPISEILFDSGVSQPEAGFSGEGVLDLGR